MWYVGIETHNQRFSSGGRDPLHSTGQYHKGGPPPALSSKLTADDTEDAPVPGSHYTFGVFKGAQALGDFEALCKHGRRVVRVHLGRDLRQGPPDLESRDRSPA